MNASSRQRSPRSKQNAPTKPINLALQGGGAHGAFAWGVMDKLLEDGRLVIDGISGTSAGSMNAVVYAYGRTTGGVDGAREALEKFWKAVSDSGQRYSMVKQIFQNPFSFGKEKNFSNSSPSPSFEAMKFLTDSFSPYQLNPTNWNPLLDLLSGQVDFDRLNQCKETKLFLSATNVRSGKVRVFNTHEITAAAVMASSCLPHLFQAVEIDGEHYWDGGYMGNPSLFPLFYNTTAGDVLIVHINPIERDNVPQSPSEIYDRVNEVTFNSSLIKELRAVAFVQKLLDEGWLKDEYRDQLRYVRIHSLRADKALADLNAASKFFSEWDFLTMLRDRGRDFAQQWLEENFDDVGKRSTVDLRREFLNSGSEQAPLQPIKPTKPAKARKPFNSLAPSGIKNDSVGTRKKKAIGATKVKARSTAKRTSKTR
jgi:NTE family protein